MGQVAIFSNFYNVIIAAGPEFRQTINTLLLGPPYNDLNHS